MNKTRTLTILVLFLFVIPMPMIFSAEVVDTDLGTSFERLFPELSEGYIDLNSNNSLDRLPDMDELPEESLIQDGILQVQEILDFILEQYRFFTVEELEDIQAVLENAEGQIDELIALSYRSRVRGAIEKKREFGSDDLYLTPSALRRGQEEMSGYIAAMLHAYKKEERQFLQRFSEARESLFSMIEAGYPLPPMSTETRGLLVSAMIHTVLTDGDSNPPRVKAAITTIGRIKAEDALPYLENLLDSPQYRVEAAEALGEIGNSQARSILMESLQVSEPGDFQYALIRSVGKIGGDESEQYLLDLLSSSLEEKNADEEEPREDDGSTRIEQTTVKALADLARQGSRNRQIYAVLTGYLNHEDPELRKMAVEGIAGFGARQAAGELLPLLKEEKNEQVKITLVRSLNSLNDASTIPSFINLLQDPAASTTLKAELISAIGSNDNGPRAVGSIMDHLSSLDQQLREVTRRAILQLYEKDPQTVMGYLSRALLQSQDRLFLEEASGILADLADPASLNTLLKLLETPYPGVKKNITWAIFRIRPDNNARIITEMQKLITSETQPLSVRTNAVRALGAMGVNTPQLEVHKTLLTTLKLKSSEYLMLKYFAVQALGLIPLEDPQVVEALLETASPREHELIRKAALQSLQKMGVADQSTADSIAGIAKRSDDPQLQMAAIRILGDMGSEETSSLADRVLEELPEGDEEIEILYALSRVESEASIELIIDRAARVGEEAFLTGLLREMPTELLKNVVTRRLKTEQNEAVMTLLESLEVGLETGY